METEYRAGSLAKRAGYAVLALCLLILLTGTAFPSGDIAVAAGKAGESKQGELSRKFETAVPVLAFGCPDLAYTDSFKANNLAYVESTGFADAIDAVANGRSTYSPHDIPAGWKAAAAEWRAYIAAYPAGDADQAHPALFTAYEGKFEIEPLLSREACAPALLYLASLEYRSRPGNRGVTPVFPRLVRNAVIDMGSQVVAKRRMAPTYAKRTAAVMAKITEAERMGAMECQPEELAQAKDELDRARRDAAGVRSDTQETDAAFARAERMAEGLLTMRLFAMQKGFKCYPE